MIVVGDGDVGGLAGVLVGVAHGYAQAGRAQHGQVVVRVAHGDGLFGGNSQLRRERQKAGALGHARVGDLDAVLLAGRALTYVQEFLLPTSATMAGGPSEIIAAESLLEMMMTEMGIQVMGKFACPGSVHRNETHDQVDGLAKKLNLPVEQAAQLLYVYKAEPEGEAVKAWPPETLEAVKAAASANIKIDMRLMGMPRSWHNQAADRPSERDIVKAEIFMAELIEDVFIPREDASIDSCYICRC